MAVADLDAGRTPGSNAVPRTAPTWLVVATSVVLLAAVVAFVLLAWGAGERDPGDSSAEAGFARDMSQHHAQAVEMAMLIIDRTDDLRIEGLAKDIALTQQNQIGQMLGWLDIWGLSTARDEPAMAWMDHPAGEPMPGLATREELNALADLSGEEADREFLRLMIRHHQGGVPMAEALLERSDNEIVTRLARSIVESQSAEVRTMESLLAGTGSEPLATPETEHHESRSTPIAETATRPVT
jgi:uncharacterized protein (DUF305 family)